MGLSMSTHLVPFETNSKEWQERCLKDKKIVNHPEYYFPDGNIIVVVDDTAFNLYRGVLHRHSSLFRAEKDAALIIDGPTTAQLFAILCEFLFPREIGVLPTVQSKDIDKWGAVIHGANELHMPSIRNYILDKLAEDKTYLATKTADFLSLVQHDDKGQEQWLIKCIQILAYRRSPLSRDEAITLSGAKTNLVALARERIRSLFYNPNYWKVRIPNTLCRAANYHCSDGVFFAMTKQMSISAQSINSSSETNLLQVAVGSMCALCRGKYAESLKRNANLEIAKVLELSEDEEASDLNYPNRVPAKSRLESSNA